MRYGTKVVCSTRQTAPAEIDGFRRARGGRSWGTVNIQAAAACQRNRPVVKRKGQWFIGHRPAMYNHRVGVIGRQRQFDQLISTTTRAGSNDRPRRILKEEIDIIRTWDDHFPTNERRSRYRIRNLLYAGISIIGAWIGLIRILTGPDGTSFDIGVPQSYRETVCRYPQQ